MCDCEKRGLMMNRTHCIVCGCELSGNAIFTKNGMPAFSQNLPMKNELKKDKPVDYELYQCTGCGLVQFNCEPISYYKDSTRAGERCDVLIKLRREQYKHLIETYNLRGKKIIEIGAGKGGFLKTLKEMSEYDIDEYGIEYREEFVSIARNKEGVNVTQGDVETPELLIDGAPFDAFTSFAYPARLINPNEMLRNVYHNTTEDVVGIIQVPSMEHLLKEGGFFDITRDHIAYYDENSLRFLLNRNGFEVIEFGEVAKIYIYAIVRKKKNYDLVNIWNNVDMFSKKVNSFFKELSEKDQKNAIWCAGHFAFTVISLSSIREYICYIIDNAEFKQNRFSPATHIPIYGPEHFQTEPVDNIIIMGPIYVDEIIEEARSKLGKNINIYFVNRYGIEGTK